MWKLNKHFDLLILALTDLCSKQHFSFLSSSEFFFFTLPPPRQAGGPVHARDHADHVVLRRVPLDRSEGGVRPAVPSAHPGHGAALHLLRRHPGHQDHVLHRGQAGEQEHPGVGQ